MKLNVRTPFSRPLLARVLFRPLALTVLLLPTLLPAQTLLHRYSFASDASDSVGGAAWTGTLVPPNGGAAATISNGLILPGNPGGGNGVSGYLSLPNGIVKGDASVTVECWVEPSSVNTWAEIWDFGSSGSVNFGLIQDSPSPGDMRVAFTPNGGEDDINTPNVLPAGAEAYIAVTYNNTNLTGDLYLNGALDGTTTFPGTNYSPGSFGGANGTIEDAVGNDVFGDPQFGGTVYELRIWNGTVSQRYISASAIVGPGVLVTNLTPLSASLTVTNNLIVSDTEVGMLYVTLAQTGSTPVLATTDTTNWTSSNPNVLQVNSQGVITGVTPGTATVTAKIGGFTATSASITVVPQILAHRYSFVSDASDSVGGSAWDGTLVGPNGGAAATIANGLMLPGNTHGGYGYSGYVSFPSGILSNDTSITVECWATQNQANTWAELWDFGNNGNQNFALIPAPGNNNGDMSVAFTPDLAEHDLTTSTKFPNGTEEYVCVTYNNYTLAGDIYTNGVLDATTTFPNTSYSPSAIAGDGVTTENALGNDVYGDDQFDGTVYEFRIWNGALSPLYVAVSAAVGPSTLVTNLTPESLTVNLSTTSMVGAQTQQATVVGNFPQMSGVTVTGGVTNWTSSNPSVLTVSSSGLITAVSGGSATVSATAGGVTATSQTITVALTAPSITQQPTASHVVSGQTVTLTVQAVGGNLSYQWDLGTSPIPGATNNTLVLTNISIGQSGNYSVVVSNALGTATSATVTVTVSQAVLEHRYSFISDASDSVGGANGTLVPGSNGGPNATIDNGLVLPGNPTGTGSGYVSLPNGIVAGDSSVTVECWVEPSSVNTWAEIWDFGSSGSVNFALIQDSPGPGDMRVAFTPDGNEHDIDAPSYLPAGLEQYIAVTYNNATLVANLYTNAVLDASTVLPGTNYSPGSYGGPSGTTENAVGNDVYGDPQFGGTVYELRIWDGVVPQAYIAASQLLGPGTVATNLTPTSASIIVSNSTMVAESTQQASVVIQIAQTGTNELVATADVTNWTSSNPSVVEVSSNGLLTAVGGGTATISATVDGYTASTSITVPFAAPTITQQPPSSANILAGGTLHLMVANQGEEPYTYLWYFDGSQPISGATSSELVVPNVQAANAGSYTVVISNAYGSVTSAPTVLTVITPSAYEADLLALKPLGFWPLNETTGTVAYDLAGGYNGTYIGNVSLGLPGPSTPEFGSASYGAGFDGTTAYVDIPEGPFNITNAITVMAWAQLESYPNFGGLFGHGDTSWRTSVNPNGDPGANDGNLGSSDATSATPIVDGNWHLVAYTYTGNTDQANNGTLYVDGAPVAYDTIAATPPGNDLDVWIGGSPDYGTARLLAANIADAAIFPQALSAADIQALYSGETILSITHSGSNITLTWNSGALLQAPTVLGPWTTNTTAVSPYTVPTTNSAEFYKVLVNKTMEQE